MEVPHIWVWVCIYLCVQAYIATDNYQGGPANQQKLREVDKNASNSSYKTLKLWEIHD